MACFTAVNRMTVVTWVVAAASADVCIEPVAKPAMEVLSATQPAAHQVRWACIPVDVRPAHATEVFRTAKHRHQ